MYPCSAVDAVQPVVQTFVLEESQAARHSELVKEAPVPQDDISVTCPDGFHHLKQNREATSEVLHRERERERESSAAHSRFIANCKKPKTAEYSIQVSRCGFGRPD